MEKIKRKMRICGESGACDHSSCLHKMPHLSPAVKYAEQTFCVNGAFCYYKQIPVVCVYKPLPAGMRREGRRE